MKTAEGSELLELSDFQDLVGETFVFSLEGVEETVSGALLSAEALPRGKAPAGVREPFRLQFQFPAGANIGQCLFQMSHPRLRSDAIFLVPVAGDDTGWYMDAHFN